MVETTAVTPQSENKTESSPTVSEPIAKSADVVPAPEESVDPSTAGFNFLMTDYIHSAKLSFILMFAIFLPPALRWLVGTYLSILSGLVLWAVLSAVWWREMRKYKDNVRVEIERRAGMHKMINDTETVEWFNLMLSRFWLIFEPMISEIVIGSVNPILEYYTPSFLDSIALSEFTLGTAAPRLTLMKGIVQTDDDVIRFNCRATFQPKDEDDLSAIKDERNSRIVLKTRVGKGVLAIEIPVLVKDISFSANLMIELRLMNGFPYVKIFSMSMPENPTIDFTLKPLNGVDVMDMPGLNNFLHKLIQDIIGWLFVQPNAFVFDLDAFMNTQVSVESAIGVLLVKVHEARGLKNIETIGKSDPYAMVRIGGRELARTRAIDNNLDPYWNESFYVLVKSWNDKFELIVNDKDILKDRLLGYYRCPLTDFGLDKNPHLEDIWKPLITKEPIGDMPVKSKGEVHFELHYYPMPDKTGEKPAEEAEIKNGILRITIHEAKQLDESKSMVGYYNPFAEVLYHNQLVYKTKTKKRTNNPYWEETFQIFIRDLDHDTLRFVVRDQRDLATDPEVGDLMLSVKDILKNLKTTANKIDWWALRNVQSGKLRISFQYAPVAMDHPVPPLTASGNPAPVPAIGVVRLRVIEAMDLKNQEAVGLSDPYVKVNYLGEMRIKTSIIENTLNPLWNETHYILAQDSSLKGKLFFEIYDFNNLSKDRKMGTCEFELKSLLAKQADGRADPPELRDLWLPVMLSKKVCGKLHIEISYYEMIPQQSPSKADSSEASTHEENVESLMMSHNSGLLRIEIDEFEIGAENDDESIDPSPYFEFYDTSGSIFSNEVANLYSSNVLAAKNTAAANSGSLNLSFLKRARSSTKDLDTLVNALERPADGRGGAKNVVLLHRSRAMRKVRTGKAEAVMEFFVRNVDAAQILIVCKDEAMTKSVIDIVKKDKVDETSPSKDMKKDTLYLMSHPILGKTELPVRSLINKPNSSHVLLDVNPKKNPVAGKFKLAVSFKPVPINEGLVLAEEELEITNSGSLSVEVLEAKNVPAMDSSGTTDAFVSVRLNNEKSQKTKILKKSSSNPKWKDMFEIKIKNRTTSRLMLELMDWNQFEGNKTIGFVVVECAKLQIDDPEDLEVPLMDDEGNKVADDAGNSCILHLKLQFKPDEKVPPRFRRVNNKPVGGSKGAVMGSVGLIANRMLAAHSERKLHKDEASQQSRDVLSTANSTSTPLANDPIVKIDPAVDVEKNTEDMIVRRSEPSAHSNVPSLQESTPVLPVQVESGSHKTPVTEVASSAAKPLKAFASNTSMVSIDMTKAGSLVIHILGAKNLKGVDASGTSDPYVKVLYAPKVTQSKESRFHKLTHAVGKREKVLYKTKTMKKSLNPVWNESCLVPFPVTPQDGLILSFAVKDYNLIGSVDIGEYELDVWKHIVKTDEASKVIVETQPGELRGDPHGILRLELEYRPQMNPNDLTAEFRTRTASFSSLASVDDSFSSTTNKKPIFG